MVRKASAVNLNSGNTIRKPSKSLAFKNVQTCGFIRLLRPSTNHVSQEDCDILSVLPDSDVEYSLNKKGRWNYPDALKETIVSQEIDGSNTQVILMEEYNSLRENRRCLAFHSNAGAVRSRIAKTRRWMDTHSAQQEVKAIDNLSKRERRKMGKTPVVKTTVSEEDNKSLADKYEFHITYGAPRTAALYTDVHRFERNSAKKGSKNLVRDFHCAESVDSDFDFSDNFSDDSDCFLDDENVPSAVEVDCEAASFSIADFLVPNMNRKQMTRRRCDSQKIDKMDRATIVCIDAAPPYSKRTKRSRPPQNVLPASYDPHYTEVQMDKTSTDADSLESVFGDHYRESYSSPRKFSIDLSSRLLDDGGVKSSRTSCYLVATLISQTSDFDIYGVYCNGNLHNCSAKLELQKPGETYSVGELVQETVEHLKAMTHLRTASLLNKTVYSSRQPEILHGMKKWLVICKDLPELAKERISQLQMEFSLNVKNHQESLKDFAFIPTCWQRSLSCSLFCGICFSALDNSTPYSSLLPCQHAFCNKCWSLHATTQITRGQTEISCPEFGCKSVADFVFILSAVEYNVYELFCEHLTEQQLWGAGSASWCTRTRCGRVIICKEGSVSAEPIPVVCSCGTSMCFKCREEPHWPISCQQLRIYHAQLVQDGKLDIVKDHIDHVYVKPCPNCQYPIEKFGGCLHMFCTRCKNNFCWQCLKATCHGHRKQNDMADTESYALHTNRSCRSKHGKAYLSAVEHREYNTPWKRASLLKGCMERLSTFVVDKMGRKSAKRCLSHIVEVICATHHLLEFCCASRMFGHDVGTELLDRLTFVVLRMEQIISDKMTVNSLVHLQALSECAVATRTALIQRVSFRMLPPRN